MTAQTIGRCLTPETTFTPGQLRVLRPLLAGDSPAEIALASGHGIRSVYEHEAGMCRRVDVQGRQLVVWCYQHRECCGWAFVERNGAS